MTEKEKQEKVIKLAKADGWKQPFSDSLGDWERPDGRMTRTFVLPDYFNDLNAVYTLENTLSDYPSRDRELYAETLWEVIKKDIDSAFGNRVVSLMHASAAQRANALGIHFKLWNA